MNRTKVKMDDLPELPFEKILSYLSLKDRIKSRAVSRSWRKVFDFKAKTLCYSELPIGLFAGKGRLVSGAFAQNFISSTRFESFFDVFTQSILSNLKHLRLCKLRLSMENRTALAPAINSLAQLEELGLFDVHLYADPNPPIDLRLNLPMLNSIHFQNVYEIGTLTLNSPKLQKVKFFHCSLRLNLDIVHGESVEWFVTDRMSNVSVKNLKNLKYLHSRCYSPIDSTFLSSLKQLKEIHLYLGRDVATIFDQKRRYDRTGLKIYFWGFLLNGPDDPAIDSLSSDFSSDLDRVVFGYLAENPSKLADEIPLCEYLPYAAIERVAPGSEMNFLNRFIDLGYIIIEEPVQDTQHFLDLLKNFSKITDLKFHCDQPQNLFDRLPEHCAVQILTIRSAPSNVEFLFRLKGLIGLDLGYDADAELIGRAFEELEFLIWVHFHHGHKVSIKVTTDHPKRFEVSRVDESFSDLNQALEFIFDDVSDPD